MEVEEPRTSISISRPTLRSTRSFTRPRTPTNIIRNGSSIPLSRQCPLSVLVPAAYSSLQQPLATGTAIDGERCRRRQRQRQRQPRRRTAYSPLLFFLGAYAFCCSSLRLKLVPVVSVHAFYPRQRPYQRSSTQTSWTGLASSSNSNGSSGSNRDDSTE
jgi:hypothetical protein